MATYTENYHLKKPALNDIANIGDINDNMDIIDDEMSKLIDSVPTMSGASASTDGESGVVPQPVAGDNSKYLRGDATYSVPGVMTINGRTPDPVTGDITVIEGGGSGSYGSYRLDATIPVSAWSGSGPYTTTITNEYIKSTMDGSETWLDNEAAMLGETTFTTRDGSLLVSTTVKPTAQWVLHVSLALNGADVLADMSASIANVADGLAILATGDTHAAISSGQFVYVRNHGSAEGFSGNAILADGLYVAQANISANGALTTSNLTADPSGGLNALNSNLASYIDNGHSKYITSSTNINSVTTPGRYYIPSQSPNAPFEGYMDVFAYDSDYVKQVAYTARNTNEKMVFRTKQSGTWSAWNEVALDSKMPTFSDNYTGSATVNSGAFVTLASFAPPADGNYLIVVNAAFGGDTSGIRILMVSLTETDVNEPSNSVLASGRSALQYVQLWGGVTTANRVYIRAYQNAENAITVYYRYRFIRL